MSERQYIEHVDPPQNEEGWIEYALQLLWSETDGYESAADNAAIELIDLREATAELAALQKRVEAKDAEIEKLKAAIKKVIDGYWCDNDGRGCGASSRVAFFIGVCPDCTWRGYVELEKGICPQCSVDWNFLQEAQ